MKISHFICALFAAFFLIPYSAYTCTNYLVTKGASTDGSTMISYAADSHDLYGELYYWPAGEYAEGTMLDVYEWDTGKYLGQIKQASRTYNVVGNMNEFQLAIGETTFGGRPELVDTTGIIDYGSLIYITLQRAKSAREAIKIMAELVEEYGYYSSGESFSIADKNEVWYMELIGKGTDLDANGNNRNKGAVWVALRIPDGYVSGHANQARITTFPLADGKVSITSNEMDKLFDADIRTVYSHDVISFAREQDYYVGKDENFSFSDTYAPVDFGGARFCEIRVWTMFNRVTQGMDAHWEYVKGHIERKESFEDGTENPNRYATNRMPLWVKPENKISPHDMMMFMRDYLQDTELDMRKDFGAGPYEVPYRWRPLTFEIDGVEYVNERATATQQTAFSFISQSRNWLPDAIGGIMWWGVNDANACVYMPIYPCITTIPHHFEVGNGAIMEWSETSGFWIFNQVSNFSYTRYKHIQPDVEIVRDGLEKTFLERTPAVDAAALTLYEQDPQLAVAYLTDYSNDQAARTFNAYKKLYQHLFMKYMDGNIKYEVEGQKYPKVEFPGYSEDFLRRLVEESGEKLRVIEEAE